MNFILAEVQQEMLRQVAMWGVQHHEDGTNKWFEAQVVERRQSNDQIAKLDPQSLTWRVILDEEVLEAYAEVDTGRLRRELIQVAAVAASWIHDLDSRKD